MSAAVDGMDDRDADDTTGALPCRLGAERSLVQIQSPRLLRRNLRDANSKRSQDSRMRQRGKLITAAGLALVVALSGCGDGNGSGSGGGKESAVTEPATSSGVPSKPSTTPVGRESAPTKAQRKAAIRSAGGGQTEKPNAHSKDTSTTKARGVPDPSSPVQTRDECVDYVNGLVIQDDERKQLLAYCRQYPH